MQKTALNESRIVRNVSASMLAEGFCLSTSTKKACADVASGKKTASQIIKARIAEYSVKKNEL